MIFKGHHRQRVRAVAFIVPQRDEQNQRPTAARYSDPFLFIVGKARMPVIAGTYKSQCSGCRHVFCDVIGKRVKPPFIRRRTEGIASHGIAKGGGNKENAAVIITTAIPFQNSTVIITTH